jgi:hypothetical protein
MATSYLQDFAAVPDKVRAFVKRNPLHLTNEVDAEDLHILVQLLQHEAASERRSLGHNLPSVFAAWKEGRLSVLRFDDTRENFADQTHFYIFKAIYGGKAAKFRSKSNMLPAFVVSPAEENRLSCGESAELIWCFSPMRRAGMGSLMLKLSGLGERPLKVMSGSTGFWDTVRPPGRGRSSSEVV